MPPLSPLIPRRGWAVAVMTRIGLGWLALAVGLTAAVVQAQVAAPPLAQVQGQGIPGFVPLADGQLLVYGSFDWIGSQPRNNLARLRVGGGLDGGWAPNPNGFVRDLVLQDDGGLIVAGEFSRLAGREVARLGRLLPGPLAELDPTYAPQLPAGVIAVNGLAAGVGHAHYASYVAVVDNVTTRGVVKLAANGAIDGGFSLTANQAIFDLRLSADGQWLYLWGGAFTEINGNPLAASFARVDAATGALDATWAPLSNAGGTRQVQVRDVELDGNDALLLAGTFSDFPGGFLRVDITGSGSASAWGPSLNGDISPLRGSGVQRFPDGDWLIVGGFTQADGQPRRAGVARLAPDGALRAGWGAIELPANTGTEPTGAIDGQGNAVTWRFHGEGQPARIYHLAASDGRHLGTYAPATVARNGSVQRFRRQPGSGRILFSSNTVNEIDGRISHVVAALRSDLSVDTGWTSQLDEFGNLAGQVYLGVSSQNLFVASFAFLAPGGAQLFGVNRLDPSTGARLDWTARASESLGMFGRTGQPSGVAVDDDGSFVYVSAEMRDSNQTTLGNGSLLRFALESGIADLSWNPGFASGLAGVAPSLEIADGYLYYGSARNVLATDDSVVPALARMALAGNGRADPGWRPFNAAATVRTLEIVGDHLYVGGNDVLLRLERASGAIDSGWSPSLPTPYVVRDIAVGTDGSVYLAGSFVADCLGQPTTALRLRPDASVDGDWGVALDRPAQAVLVPDVGGLLLGGDFSLVNGKPYSGFVHLSEGAGSEYCGVREVASPIPDAGSAETLAPSSDAAGRYITYQSLASSADDGDGEFDIYRVDSACVDGLDPAGAPCEAVELVSQDATEASIVGAASEPSISADGQLIVFLAEEQPGGKRAAADHAAGPAGVTVGVFLRNMLTGVTTRVGSAPDLSAKPRLSPTGNAVVFSQLNDGSVGAAGQIDVYLRPIARSGADAPLQPARCVSCKAFDDEGQPTAQDSDGDSDHPVVSADGQWVAWQTTAKNSLPQASPCIAAARQIVLRNILTGQTRRVGDPSDPAHCGSGSVGSQKPAMDYSGRKLAFESDLALAGNGAGQDVFFFDAGGNELRRVSAHADGGAANGSSGQPAISGDGATIAYVSTASDLDLGDSDQNGVADLIVHSLRDSLNKRLARASDGSELDAPSSRPALGYSGRQVLFDSPASALAGGAGSGAPSVYRRDSTLEVVQVFASSFE